MKKYIFPILAVLGTIFVIAFGVTTYRYYEALHSDDSIDPYLLVELGQATVTRGTQAIDMEKSESYDLREGDVIITRAASQAVVNWPDHSTTRLGENSRLTIDRMRVAADYSRIELVAVLESGKAWSNIVRTLYPDSKIEFRMPSVGTVAGVRGTVFDLNLTANYIQSISHSVTLRDRLGKAVSLMPWEAVRANNIFQKIAWGLDQAWITANSTADAAYNAVRTATTQAQTVFLAGKNVLFDWWHQFVRWVLSFFGSFRDLESFRALAQWDTTKLRSLSPDVLMRWYQRVQGEWLVQERETLRGLMMMGIDTFKNGDKVIDTLARGALWDTLASTGGLNNANMILNRYTQQMGTTLDSLLDGMKKVDPNATIQQGTNTLRTFLERF